MNNKGIVNKLGDYTVIRTGKLDANAKNENGKYPFFTCAIEPLEIDTFSYDCECVLVAGNGDLNVKYYSGKFDAYQRTYIIESLDKKKLDVRYLYYFLDKYLERLRSMSIGGVIKYIKLGYLKDAEIPLPPLPEQKRIAAILDKADAIRRKRQETLTLTENLIQSTFLDIFGDPVSNPKGWPKKFISEIAEKVTDGTHKTPKYTSTGVKFISAKNLRTHGIDWSDVKYISSEEHDQLTRRCDPRRGDVLMAKSGRIGSAVTVKENHEFSCFESLALIRISPDIMLPEFFASLMNSNAIIRQYSRSIKGVAVKHLHLKEIRNMKIIVPSLFEQMKFKSLCQQYSKIRRSFVKCNEFNSLLFNSLQQRAFNGELSNN